MFQDVSFDGVNIKSNWKREKFTSKVSTQTSEVLTNDIHIQTVGLATAVTQTSEAPKKPFKLVVDNSSELKEFLKRVEPMICDQLKRNTESHAFDGYEVEWEEESTVVTCTHTLTEAATNSEYHCTGLSWNSTGSVLAVAYGRLDHQDWCSHKSYLCTWNLDRRLLDSNKADVTIDDAPSCLTCVCYHPELPAVIAAGTFSGEVRVWNTGLTGDPLVASSGFSDLGHKEPVAKVTWILDQESMRRRYLLLSLGNDGKVLIWELVSNQKELKLQRGLRLLTESVPRSIRVSKAKGDAEIGGTCLSFSSEDKNLFLVGSENGGIYKCSLQSLLPSIEGQVLAETDMKSPIKFSFRPHYGPVYGISCSPFHRNLFLSCATDTTTRLYSLLDPDPILSLEPVCGYLFSVCWSVSRPLVFAVGTGNGQVLLFDLKSSQTKPRVALDASPHKRPIYSLTYNHNRPQLLATGDASGVVKVWRLSTELTAQASNEIDLLNSLALQILSNS